MFSTSKVTKQPQAASRISNVLPTLTPAQKIESMFRNAMSIERAAKQARRPSLHYPVSEILYHGNRAKAGLAISPEHGEEAVRRTLAALNALGSLSCAHADATQASRHQHVNRTLERAVDIETKRLDVAIYDLQTLAILLDSPELN